MDVMDVLGFVMDFPRSLVHSLVVMKPSWMLSNDHSKTCSSYLVIRNGVGQFLDESGQGLGVISVA
jgi:hypothetical protein